MAGVDLPRMVPAARGWLRAPLALRLGHQNAERNCLEFAHGGSISMTSRAIVPKTEAILSAFGELHETD